MPLEGIPISWSIVVALMGEEEKRKEIANITQDMISTQFKPCLKLVRESMPPHAVSYTDM